jgi:hypothetical protein
MVMQSISTIRAFAPPKSERSSAQADEPGRCSPGLAQGLSIRDIARRLQLEPSGVRAQISVVVQKLGVENRQQAVDFFRSTTGE